jgi:putative transposase
LGATKTHSRPRVSNDNLYSESQFKIWKHLLDFPDHFGSPKIDYEDARACVGSFFDWYNQKHYHSSLELLTLASVHYPLATDQMELRPPVLDNAISNHSERFARKPPSVQPLPQAVWINRPEPVFEVGEEPTS